MRQRLPRATKTARSTAVCLHTLLASWMFRRSSTYRRSHSRISMRRVMRFHKPLRRPQWNSAEAMPVKGMVAVCRTASLISSRCFDASVKFQSSRCVTSLPTQAAGPDTGMVSDISIYLPIQYSACIVRTRICPSAKTGVETVNSSAKVFLATTSPFSALTTKVAPSSRVR